MREYFWRAVAYFAAKPDIANWLVHKSRATPYTDITSADGQDLYMGRCWLFNAYSKDANGDPGPARIKWLPSIRIHHICRPYHDRHLHDHPWNARTIILRGWYREIRMVAYPESGSPMVEVDFPRPTGYTGRLLFGEYHRITEVSPGGVWTLFITWKKRGRWGFLKDGVKVYWRTYLGLDQ